MDPTSIDIDARVAAHPEWPQWRDQLVDRFGPLADAVLTHAERMYPTREDLRTRLETLVASWTDIFTDASTTLRPADELEAELQSADCPTRFAEIGVDAERGRRAIAWSKDIRARYTILHLAAELGMLDTFAARYIEDYGGH
jgi:glycerol-1-phosphate dehydrogenase [NAD(P)+]